MNDSYLVFIFTDPLVQIPYIIHSIGAVLYVGYTGL
jgi:hypothetical protein